MVGRLPVVKFVVGMVRPLREKARESRSAGGEQWRAGGLGRSRRRSSFEELSFFVVVGCRRFFDRLFSTSFSLCSAA